MPISHVFNCTIADDPAAQAAGEILPSHWNATHSVLINLTSEVSGILAASNGGMATGFTGTNASGTLNSNGLALSVNAGGGAAFSGGVSTGGNTLGNTGTVSNQIVFAGGNNVTLSQSTNAGGATVTISAFNQTNQTVASGNIAGTGFTSASTAGTDIVATLNTAGLSVGVPKYITTFAAQSVQPVAISGSNGSFAYSTLTAGNLNGISFYTSNGSLVASHNGLTSQSNPAFSAQGGSSTFQTLSFSNANGISFSNNAGQVQASYTVPTVTNSSMTVSDSATSGTLARLAFTNLNGVTLSLSTGAGGSHTIVGSHNALTSQSNQAFSASGGSSAFQTLNFANSNGLTFSNSNGSVIASYTVPIQSAQTIGLYGVSNTTGASSSSTIDARSFSMQGAGAASVGLSNGSWIISAPNAGAGNVTISAGANSAGLASLVFSNSNGVSFGLNGSTITASVNAGGGGGLMSTYIPVFPGGTSAAQIGSIGNTTGSVHLFPIQVQHDIYFNELRLYGSLSHITSVGGASQTFGSRYALFSNNAGTLSQISSSSFSVAVTVSSVSATYSYPNSTDSAGYTYGTTTVTGSAQAQSLFGTVGGRFFGLNFGNTMSLSAGQYWLGALHTASTSSASGGVSCNVVGISVGAIFNSVGLWGFASSAFTTQSDWHRQCGQLTVTTTGMPSTIAMSQINNNFNVLPLMTFIAT